MPTALITGVTGQDGAYLAQLLLGKGYRVVGLMRRSASSDVIGERLRWLGILDDVELVDGNLTDISSLIRILAGLTAPWAGSVECAGAIGLIDDRAALDPQQPLGLALRFWADIDGDGIDDYV